MPELAFLLLFLAALAAFLNWRHGLALCVLTAILQDPMRKLTPGEPVYFVVLVGVVFAAAWLGALFARVPLTPRSIHGWRRHVGVPFVLFVVLVLLQAAHSLARFGNPMMTALGLLFYFSPVPALVFGYQFAVRRGLQGVSRWMRIYVAVASLALGSVYLEYSGVESATLGQVGEGIVIYDVGTILTAYAGFFRSSEIAAWHAATIACFVFMLLFGRRLSISRALVATALVVFLLGVGMLTGRRKMLVEVAIFISVYLMLAVWFQRGAWKLAVLAAGAGLASYVAVVGMVPGSAGEPRFDSHAMQVAPHETYRAYTLRGQSVIGDIPDRFSGLGIQPVSWALTRFGVFGAGLGTGSQGVQSFSSANMPDRVAAEGGLGKLTMELGLPGLLLAGWMFVALARYVWLTLYWLSRRSMRHARFGFGLVAFLTANVAAFSVAAQAYGDLFILLSLGWSLGILLALPILVEQLESRKPSPRASRATLPAARSRLPEGSAHVQGAKP